MDRKFAMGTDSVGISLLYVIELKTISFAKSNEHG
jgi:hypothetical protein